MRSLKTYWHVTTIEALPSIMREGIRPSRSRRGTTELCPSWRHAVQVAGSPFFLDRKTAGYVVLKVWVPGAWVAGTTWRCRRVIGPRRIAGLSWLGGR